MACGGCSMKYKATQQGSVAITDPGKRSRKGVIKASTFAVQQTAPSSLQEEGAEELPPLSENPVDGDAGPSTEQE